MATETQRKTFTLGDFRKLTEGLPDSLPLRLDWEGNTLDVEEPIDIGEISLKPDDVATAQKGFEVQCVSIRLVRDDSMWAHSMGAADEVDDG